LGWAPPPTGKKKAPPANPGFPPPSRRTRVRTTNSTKIGAVNDPSSCLLPRLSRCRPVRKRRTFNFARADAHGSNENSPPAGAVVARRRSRASRPIRGRTCARRRRRRGRAPRRARSSGRARGALRSRLCASTTVVRPSSGTSRRSISSLPIAELVAVPSSATWIGRYVRSPMPPRNGTSSVLDDAGGGEQQQPDEDERVRAAEERTDDQRGADGTCPDREDDGGGSRRARRSLAAGSRCRRRSTGTLNVSGVRKERGRCALSLVA